MRREQYLRYYKETESMVDILVDQSEDKFDVKRTQFILYRRKFLVLKRKNRKTVSSQKNEKTATNPLQSQRLCVILLWCCKLQP